MFRLNYRYSLALTLAIAACGGSAAEPAKPAPQPAATTAADPIPLCERLFARKATCADDYLPALIDLHVELNIPPGYGDRVKAEGRDALLAKAHSELERDTEPAKVTELCKTTAAKMPPERIDQLVEQGGKCDAAADCKEFASCVVLIDRGFITAGARQQAAAPSEQ